MPYSYAVYTGNGATTQFTVPFPYIRREHVVVSLNYVSAVFTWVNNTTVQVSPAPANAVRVEVRRVTPVNSPLVDFTDGSTLVAADLDTNALQQTYINQEQDDQIQQGIYVDANGNLTAGNQVLKDLLDPVDPQDAATKNYTDTRDALKVSKAGDIMTGALAMSGQKITGLGDPTNAQDATTKNWVETATTSPLVQFRSIFYGAYAADPAVDPYGAARTEGDLYFNSTTDQMRVFNGTSWQEASADATITRFLFTAVGGETSLSGNDDNAQSLTYNVGLEMVYINGALMTRGVDYVATTGSSITGLAALSAADLVEVVAFSQIDAIGSIPSANSTFLQAGTGAVQRTVDNKLKDFVSILDFIPVAEHAGIKAKTSTYDCTTALQNALTQAGRVYMPTGKYRVTQTITVSVAAGFAERPELIGAGGNTSNTQIDFVPAVAGSALFSHFHNATYRGIYFTGPGDATGTGERCFDFGNVGTQRHTIIEECMFRYWDSAALYFSGQWQFTIDNCRFLDCGDSASPAVLTGGIVFDQTAVVGWSTSGMVISNCYFSGCSYGYYAEAAWNLTFINPIFEYCAYPYWRNAAGSSHVIINPWYEFNANDPISLGPMIVFGGRGVGWSGNNVTTSAESGSVHMTGSGIQVYKTDTARVNVKGNGNIAFENGYGIDFSATAGSGASSSVLTDYEIGDWTPVVTDGTNSSATAATIAKYTKIGNVVNIRAVILNVDTTGMTAGSQIRITGLPYVTAATANTWQHLPVTVADVTSTEGTIVGQLRNNSTQLLLNNQTASGLSSAVVSQITSGVGDFWLNFTYSA
jgi:hypothetical protein